MKVFFSTLAGLIVIVILAAVIAGFILWSRVPDMLANNLSKKMKVSVAIDSIGLRWGRINLRKIEIGNPPNSILPKAFSSSEIDVIAPFTRYLNRRIVIDEINLSDVYLGLEFDSPTSTRGNWTTIMNNIQSTTAAGGVKQKQGATAPQGNERSVLIHRVVLTNINVDLVYKKDGGQVRKLPPIPRMELTEISSEGGIPIDQITNSLLGEMLKQIFIKENLKNMLQDLMNQPANPIQKFISPFKNLFGEAEEEAVGE
jgi:uncharacterized protein involved in outer membrane biogenesis